MTTLPILTYHSLDDSGSPISVAPATFERQIRWLAQHGFKTLTLSDGLARLRGGRLPDRAVALTFDDGFLNTVTRALPALSTHGFKATVFLVSAYLGRSNDFPTQPPGTPRLPLMDWSGAEQLCAAGWEIGAHTETHPDLMQLPAADVHAELSSCRHALEQRLSVNVRAFAYPYGRFGRRERAIAGEIFATAVGTTLGFARPRSDPLALKRIDAYYVTRPDLVHCLASPLLPTYLGVRQAMRWARGRS
jgi:peptidoglycan/xylan/chitin deacetylase (PgdA/CDA1 family)